MSLISRGGQDTPSGRLVLTIGFLMTGSFWIRFTEFLQVSVDFTWFLPLLAGWLSYKHGIGVLRACRPLALLPSLGVTLDGGVGFRFGVSNTTLLLSLVIAAAVGRRFALPSPRRWLRGDTALPVIAGFCLLGVAALDVAPWRVVLSRGTQFSPLMGIENSPPGSDLSPLWTDEAGFQLLFQSVRVATNVERDRVMQ